MNSYEGLADAYDGLTTDVNYGLWLKWYLRWLSREKEPVEQILDLGCGTGTLTCMLAEKGYDTIGVDLSEDMLTLAMDKACELEPEHMPLFLCQSMDQLRLCGKVDACVCSLDCINYMTDRRSLSRTFRQVGKYLRPGGLFLFDVIPDWEFARRDGQIFVDENEDTFCLWRASYDKRSHILTYGMDLFRSAGENLWEREQEEHRERGWNLALLEQLLREAGFETVTAYGADRRSAPAEKDDRVFFVCRNKQ